MSPLASAILGAIAVGSVLMLAWQHLEDLADERRRRGGYRKGDR